MMGQTNPLEPEVFHLDLTLELFAELDRAASAIRS